MVEICSKSLVRAIGKVLLINLARTQIETHKGDEKWPLFVNNKCLWHSNPLQLHFTLKDVTFKSG